MKQLITTLRLILIVVVSLLLSEIKVGLDVHLLRFFVGDEKGEFEEQTQLFFSFHFSFVKSKKNV